ncbi:hypothetical protein ADICYQ_2202 [Cyclobacterium qasimii M12-11B]|uniref:Uncharacterized protein n=1 Tax=Cyclobacterium qasimii M12-11B TaxID=641524 RepID=S7VFN2_9BACT|nr:hypothetical protein ADICYQ_2202 [Cyclobacterium qasimii M12-11B]
MLAKTKLECVCQKKSVVDNIKPNERSGLNLTPFMQKNYS